MNRLLNLVYVGLLLSFLPQNQDVFAKFGSRALFDDTLNSIEPIDFSIRGRTIANICGVHAKEHLCLWHTPSPNEPDINREGTRP